MAQYRLGYEHARQELAPSPFLCAERSAQELEDIRQDHLKRAALPIPAPHGHYFLEHRKDYTIPLEETQRLPVQQIRRRQTQRLTAEMRLAAEAEMRRHGSIE